MCNDNYDDDYDDDDDDYAYDDPPAVAERVRQAKKDADWERTGFPNSMQRIHEAIIRQMR
jgi:hypothetical protein